MSAEQNNDKNNVWTNTIVFDPIVLDPVTLHVAN